MSAKRASHLVRSLRALARDSKASPKIRLRACELLVQIDTTIHNGGREGITKPSSAASLRQLLGDATEPQ